jgi:hypothetical protein
LKILNFRKSKIKNFFVFKIQNISKEKQADQELRAAQEKIKRLEAENALLKKLE